MNQSENCELTFEEVVVYDLLAGNSCNVPMRLFPSVYAEWCRYRHGTNVLGLSTCTPSDNTFSVKAVFKN